MMAFTPEQQGGAIGAAVAWVEGTLLGSAATTAAVIAVASLGYLMLTGRMDLRRAAEVVLGCFIIFGAASIAAGIRGLGSLAGAAPPEPAAVAGLSAPAPPGYPAAEPVAYDPYAGASVPPR